ncbi:MAG: PilZ domain-containing protein [Lachnospiraceae bacterium]|nr:PilZ domain-containing protein [Lachnospiraceae bacterium]
MQLNNVKKGTEIIITCDLNPSIEMKVTAADQMEDIEDILVTTCAYDESHIPILPNEDITYCLSYTDEIGKNITIDDVAISFDDTYNTYAIQYIEMLTVKKQRDELRILYEDAASCHFEEMNTLYMGMIHDVSKSGIGIEFPAGSFTDKFKENELVTIMFDAEKGKKARIQGNWRYSLLEEDGNIRCGFRLLKISDSYRVMVAKLLAERGISDKDF